MKIKLIALATFLGFSISALGASSFTLPQLDPSQTDPIFRTLASAVAFRPVQPASSLGVWGFSVGITGLQASTNQVTSIIGSGVPQLYDGDINAMIQVPFGLAVEAGVLPNMTISGTTVSRYGIDGKWTFTDLFFSWLPFNAALRAMYTNASLSYSQALNGGNINVNYNTNIYGGNLSLSKKLLIFEPFISYGIIQHSSTLSGTGTANLFNGNFPPGTTSTSGSGSSGWFQLGVQLKVAFFTVAAEYDNLFLDDTYAARIGFSF